MKKQLSQYNSSTQKFIRSRRISAILPWLGILGMLLLVLSLIVYGFLVFLTELGFVINFYYFIDSYNWLADRLLFDPQKKILTHRRDKLVQLMMWIFIVLALIATILLTWLRKQNFLFFIAGLCFISICYFGSRAIENCLVIFHIQLNNWKKFYTIVTVGTILSITIAIVFLNYNVLIYYVFFGIIGTIYWLTYYILVELYRRVENDLGGHKYFIDLPDNRFAHKFF